MEKLADEKNVATFTAATLEKLSAVYWNRILGFSNSRTQQIVRRVSSVWNNNVKRYYATCIVSLDFNTIRKLSNLSGIPSTSSVSSLSSASSASSAATIPGVAGQAVEPLFPLKAQQRLLHECARPDKIKLTYGHDNWKAVNKLICENRNNAEVKEIDFQMMVSECLLPLADQLNQSLVADEKKFDEKTINRMPKLKTLNIIAMKTSEFAASDYGFTVEKNASIDVRFWPLFAQLTTLTVRANFLECFFYPEIFKRIVALKMSLLLRSFKFWIAIDYNPDILEVGRFLSVCPLLEEFEVMVENYAECSQYLLPALSNLHNLRRVSFLPFAFAVRNNYWSSISYFMEQLSQQCEQCSQLTTIEIYKRPKSTNHTFLNPNDSNSMMQQMPNLQKLVLYFGGSEATSIFLICGILPYCRGLVELECPLSMEECDNTVSAVDSSSSNFKKIFYALAKLPVLRKLTLNFIYTGANKPSDNTHGAITFYFIEGRTKFLDKVKTLFARTSPGLELILTTTKSQI